MVGWVGVTRGWQGTGRVHTFAHAPCKIWVSQPVSYFVLSRRASLHSFAALLRSNLCPFSLPQAGTRDRMQETFQWSQAPGLRPVAFSSTLSSLGSLWEQIAERHVSVQCGGGGGRGTYFTLVSVIVQNGGAFYQHLLRRARSVSASLACTRTPSVYELQHTQICSDIWVVGEPRISISSVAYLVRALLASLSQHGIGRS